MWVGVKRKAAENAEARGNPLVVKCDLSWEPMEIQVDGGVYITRCKWDVIPDDEPSIDKLPGPLEDEIAP